MKCSIEISMYPLDKDYTEPIISFIQNLRKYSNILIETNGMSTQIFGDYDHIINIVSKEMKKSFVSKEKVVFNLKIINSDLHTKPSF